MKELLITADIMELYCSISGWMPEVVEQSVVLVTPLAGKEG